MGVRGEETGGPNGEGARGGAEGAYVGAVVARGRDEMCGRRGVEFRTEALELCAEGGEVGFCDFVGGSLVVVVVVVVGFGIWCCVDVLGSGRVGAVLVVPSCVTLSVCVYTSVDRLVVVVVNLSFLGGGGGGSTLARRGKLGSGFGRD